MEKNSSVKEIVLRLLRDPSLRKYTKFSEKLTILPLDTHTYMFVSGGKC